MFSSDDWYESKFDRLINMKIEDMNEDEKFAYEILLKDADLETLKTYDRETKIEKMSSADMDVEWSNTLL